MDKHALLDYFNCRVFGDSPTNYAYVYVLRTSGTEFLKSFNRVKITIPYVIVNFSTTDGAITKLSYLDVRQ